MQGQQQQQSQFKLGQTYILTQPNLGKILKEQDGLFEAVYNGQSFLVSCEPGHSIVDIIPNGTKNVWLITRQEQTGQETEEHRARGAGA